MTRMEALRQTVTLEEIEHSREALKPKPKKSVKKKTPVTREEVAGAREASL